MSSLLDHQIGFKQESTYNTPVTVDRFYELLADSKHDFDAMPLQGKGLRTSKRYVRSARRFAGVGKGAGTIHVEMASKGLGTLLQWAAGTATSTLVSGTTYQQVYTPVLSTPYMAGATIQYGIVRMDASGTVDAYTYSGCSCTQWTLEVPEGGIATLSADWDGRSLATATALATASFPSSPTLFSHSGPATGAVTTTGTLTPPTTTAIGTGGTAATNVRSWTLSVDNGLDVGRWIVGGRNQPTSGQPAAKLKANIEYDSTTLRALQLSQGACSFSSTLTTGESLSAGSATLQLVIPDGRINSGSLPDPAAGETVRTDVELEIMDDGTNQPWYIVIRTADSAL